MPLFELFWIGQRSDGRGLRLPFLLGRLHLGLIFAGPNSTTGKKSSDNLRSFLFISAILITKCGSSSFPNRTKNSEHNNISSSSSTISSTYVIKHIDGDYQDFPVDYHKFVNAKSLNQHHLDDQYYGTGSTTHHVKTLGYFLKGLILPMLISLTLSFGFIIYKNRVKRARLQAIQNALDEARANPNQISSYRPDGLLHTPGDNGFVSNALLSFIDSRGEWSLIRGNEGPLLEPDDYIGEGGETARHKPYLHDLPPDYATVFDPPTYEEATTSLKLKRDGSSSIIATIMDEVAAQVVSSSRRTLDDREIEDEEDEDEAKYLMSCVNQVDQ